MTEPRTLLCRGVPAEPLISAEFSLRRLVMLLQRALGMHIQTAVNQHAIAICLYVIATMGGCDNAELNSVASQAGADAPTAPEVLPAAPVIPSACPLDTPPTAGEPCVGQAVCTYHRDGPCPAPPAIPDQIRACYEGRWIGALATCLAPPAADAGLANAEDGGA
jgi:hypothetical protein